MNGAVVTTRYSQQSCVALSIREAELYATDCIQVKNILESMELKVKLPAEVGMRQPWYYYSRQRIEESWFSRQCVVCVLVIYSCH